MDPNETRDKAKKAREQGREKAEEKRDDVKQKVEEKRDEAKQKAQEARKKAEAEVEEIKARAKAEAEAEMNKIKSMAEAKQKELQAQVDAARAELDAAKEVLEAQVKEIEEKIMSKVKEMKAKIADALNQVDEAYKAIEEIKKKILEAVEQVKEEVKGITNIIEDVVKDARSELTSIIQDFDKAEQIVQDAKNRLAREIQEAIPRIKKVIEGIAVNIQAKLEELFASIMMKIEGIVVFIQGIVEELKDFLGITDLKWLRGGDEVEEAMVGEEIVMQAKADDLEDGEALQVSVYEYDYYGKNDHIKDFDATVSGGKVEVPWELEYHKDTDDVDSADELKEKGYSKPEYIFIIKGKDGKVKDESPVLEVQDWIELNILEEESGETVANAEYTLKFQDGSEKKGNLNDRGFARVENIPPGKVKVSIGEGGFDRLCWLKDGLPAEEAKVGEKVTLFAELDELPDGTTVTVTIYEKDEQGENDKIKEYTSVIQNKRISLDWIFEYNEDMDDVNSDQEQAEKGYTKPEYIFVVESEEHDFEEESGVLEMQDWIEFELVDSKTGVPLAGAEYILKLPDGEERKGTLDADGYLAEEDIPPGMFELTIDGYVLEID